MQYPIAISRLIAVAIDLSKHPARCPICSASATTIPRAGVLRLGRAMPERKESRGQSLGAAMAMPSCSLRPGRGGAPHSVNVHATFPAFKRCTGALEGVLAVASRGREGECEDQQRTALLELSRGYLPTQSRPYIHGHPHVDCL